MDLWRSLFQLLPTFFGLNRESIYNEIHEIVFHGKGGYQWDIVYDMPVRLRRFVFNKLKDFYTKENESNDKGVVQDPNKSLMPDIVKSKMPEFSTKASPAKTK